MSRELHSRAKFGFGIGVLMMASAACSSSSDDDAPAADPSDSSPAAMTMSTPQGLTIEVRSSPEQPPGRGDSTIEYRVTNAEGLPVDGLDLAIVPWMPVMGHGTSIVPTVEARGGGRYEAQHVVLFMPGQWDLRTTIGGDHTDEVAPSFQIP